PLDREVLVVAQHGRERSPELAARDDLGCSFEHRRPAQHEPDLVRDLFQERRDASGRREIGRERRLAAQGATRVYRGFAPRAVACPRTAGGPASPGPCTAARCAPVHVHPHTASTPATRSASEPAGSPPWCRATRSDRARSASYVAARAASTRPASVSCCSTY